MTLAWVTGAAGFIGRHLVRHLATRDVRVAGLDRVGAGDLIGAVTSWQTGQLSRSGLTALAAQTGLPDTIYHLAGGSSVGASLNDPLGDFVATVDGTTILLDWLRTSSSATRLVIVSSAAVYGDSHHDRIADDAKTAPFSPYGAHKFAMEAICRGWAGSFELSIVAVRLFSVYGPGLAKQLLWDLSGRLIEGRNSVLVGGTGKELRDWTHVSDVVRALVATEHLASKTVPIVNAGSGVAGSVRDIAEGLARAFGRDPACLHFTQQSRPGDPFSLVAAPGVLAAQGFEWSIDVDAGLSDYARWYEARNTA